MAEKKKEIPVPEVIAYCRHICDQNIKRIQEEQKKTAKAKLPELPIIFWDISDFDTRRKRDHVEVYNKITGEPFFEASCETEAWRDLREELAVRDKS